jgi:EAL and modified HD-GYP domain-containing signal transduction protein
MNASQMVVMQNNMKSQTNDRIFVGRQPILDTNENIFAYEILFRSAGKAHADVTDNLVATSSVLLHLLQNFGIETLLGNKKGFINIDESVIDEGIIDLLPADKTVLELLETTLVNPCLIDKIKSYKDNNYIFALDDFVFSKDYTNNFYPLFNDVSFIKVDIRACSKLQILKSLQEYKRPNIKLLAEKVETQEEFEFCKKAGFEYFQGYYFAKPLIVSAKKVIDPSVSGIISLIKILRNEDTTIKEFSDEMKYHPEINLNLLKFINSSAFFLKSDISSIRHAAALLGKDRLSKWLTLLLYAAGKSMNPIENPLMQTALERASTMEKLAEKLGNKLAEKAFLVGLLSLLEVILEAPFDTFIDQFHVSNDIKQAVQGDDSVLSKLLKLTIMCEEYTLLDNEPLLAELSLSMSDIAQARLESFVIKKKNRINGL